MSSGKGVAFNKTRMKSKVAAIKDGKHGTPIEHDEEFAGPITDRECRDIPMCILFILFWVGMIAVGIMGFSLGNPNRLVYGTDMNGNICGFDNTRNKALADHNPLDMTGLDYLFFGDPTEIGALQVCVAACPTSFPDLGSQDILDATNYFKKRVGTEVFCPPDFEFESATDIYVPYINEDAPCYISYPSEPVWRRCVPSPGVNNTIAAFNSTASGSKGQSKIMGEINSAQDFTAQLLADVIEAKWIILAGCGIALGLAFIWLLLLKYFAGIMVWATILLIVAVMALLSFFMFTYASEAKAVYDADVKSGVATTSQRNNAITLQVFAYSCVGFTLLLICAIVFMRSRINLAIDILQEASAAIEEMPLIILVPPCIFLAVGVFLFYWVAAWMFLGTAGTPVFDDKGEFVGYESDKTVRTMQIYHVFGMLWTTQFLLGIGEVTVAGSVAAYYFKIPDEDGDKDLEDPVSTSFKRTMRYHLGSIAFGSLLIAIVQFIRLVLEYVEKNLEGMDNPVTNFLIKCLQCCFWCLEKFLKFITRNAYIQIAIHGESFCVAAKDAFQLLMRNALRLVAVNFIGDFLLFLGKIIIVISTTMISFTLLRQNENIVYYAFPALIIFILAYVIAATFMQLYEMAIDTIFLAFCEDCEREDPNDPTKKYMSENLKEFMANNKVSISSDEEEGNTDKPLEE